MPTLLQMATKKTSSRSQSTGLIRRVAVNLFCAFFFIGVIGGGSYFLKQHVDHHLTYTTGPVKVAIKNKPAWMSEMLAVQIAQIVRPTGTHSAFDRQMLADASAALQASPWVKSVRSVRRAFGDAPGDTIEIDAEFRAPVALVRWGNYFWLVDGDGVKLPEQFSPTQDEMRRIILGRDGRVNIRVVEGVKRPPTEAGKKWSGEDLSAALDMIKILHGNPFAEEIISINVQNFAGRSDPREAQVVLKTRHNTEIRWGRPIDAKDYYVEVATSQKLDRLRQVFEQYGRVDAGRAWIDIRFDRVTYPTPEAQANTGR